MKTGPYRRGTCTSYACAAWCAALTVTLLLPSSNLLAQTPASRLRVMTWNISAGKDRAGTANIDAQVSLMARSRAHVVALQEVSITVAGDLSIDYREKLSAATGVPWTSLWIEEPRPAPAPPQGNLLLTRLPVLASAVTTFDTAPTDPNALDAKRAAGRIAVVFNGVTVTIATTELALDTAHRQRQVDQLQDWLATVPAPRVV